MSRLATHQVPVPRDTIDRSSPVYGVAVHCTGSGIVTKALKKARDPFEYAVEYYGSAKFAPYFAHYCIGFNGEIAQVADEHENAQHVGFPPSERAAFLDGTWADLLPGLPGRQVVKRWRQRWPSVKSPAHLFPGSSPNQVYVGVELLVWQAGCAGMPIDSGGLYTLAQYRALADLAHDIGRRWEFPAGWYRTGRLCTHEDLNPLQRSAQGQCWDPGVMRDRPWFNWDRLASALGQREAAVS